MQAAPAVPWKRATGRNGVTCIQKDDHKSRLTCTLQADKTKRLRTEGIVTRIDDDHIAGKCDNSRHHCNLIHTCIPMPQAMKYRQRKKQWTKNGET